MKLDEKIKSFLLERKGINYITNPNEIKLPKIRTFGVWLESSSFYKSFIMLKEHNGYFTFEYKDKSEGNLERENKTYAITFDSIEEAVKFDIALFFYEMDFPTNIEIFLDRVTPHIIKGETTKSRDWFYIEHKNIKNKYNHIKYSVVYTDQNSSLYYEEKDKPKLFRVMSDTKTIEFDSISPSIRTAASKENKTITLDIDYFEEDIPNELLHSLANILNNSFDNDIFYTYHLINNLFSEYGYKIYSIRIMYIDKPTRTIEQNIDLISNNPIFLNVFVKINGISYRCIFDSNGYIGTEPLEKEIYRIEDLEYIDSECKKLLNATLERNLTLKLT